MNSYSIELEKFHFIHFIFSVTFECNRKKSVSVDVGPTLKTTFIYCKCSMSPLKLDSDTGLACLTMLGSLNQACS